MSFDPVPYNVPQALLHWAIVFGGCAAIVTVFAFLISLLVLGRRGPKVFFEQVASGLREFTQISFRRIGALAVLTIREAVRRKALYVFVVFAALFMFASWFLPKSNERPDLEVKVAVSFVLTTITWIVMPLTLLLACWGIPEDIRNRSLHTVVTKPVRRFEIVIGRILGFGAVSTLVLVLMGAVGYVWIVRQMSTDDARANLISRVPIYGNLSFLDREGKEGAGVNVGYMWEFRSYIEGASKARAIWQFEDITEKRIRGEELVLESRFEVFRTHMGEVGKGVAKGVFAQVEFVNPDDRSIKVEYPAFEVQEFRPTILNVNRKLVTYDADGKPIEYDLFKDIAPKGRLEMQVRCLDGGQYLGTARPDLFVRLPSRPFVVGFSKAVFGIWLMMMLLTTFGVTASTFLKGPVATLATFSLILVGQGFRGFLESMTKGELHGGGPIEAIVRIVTHMNVVVPLDDTPVNNTIQAIDRGLVNTLWLAKQIIPDFTSFRMTPYVANGFDVDFSAAILPSMAIALGYLVPCLLIGYYALKIRELEAK